ncbi:putative Zn finger protein [Arthrobacter globiformis]|uniref:hypothetical protein n=1 Tax=Arthrobacter globiformis TaxID=1665 RepID=UPI00278AF5EE|nr:hypothetical protein [Arthrobacter globiformis]MDQ1058201.1 putative Zn finger protein [Arthrobacter globiformis]
MSTISYPHLPAGAHQPDGEDLQCPECHTDRHLIIHSIEEWTTGTPGKVDVTYTCAACGQYYRHPATFPQTAAVLNRPGPRHAAEVLQFGSEYIHCGEPMHAAGSELRSVYAPVTTEQVRTEQTSQGALEVYLHTRVLRCACGFQMELPQ